MSKKFEPPKVTMLRDYDTRKRKPNSMEKSEKSEKTFRKNCKKGQNVLQMRFQGRPLSYMK